MAYQLAVKGLKWAFDIDMDRVGKMHTIEVGSKY